MRKKRTTQFISSLICLSLVISMFVFDMSRDVSAGALSTRSRRADNSITASDVKSYINNLVNSGYFGTSESNKKWNHCYDFVLNLCENFYGYTSIGSQGVVTGTSKCILTGNSGNFTQVGSTLSNSLSNKVTASNLQALFSKVQPGDIVQMDTTKADKDKTDSIHVLMVYDVTSSGVTFYHYYSYTGSNATIGGSSSTSMYGSSMSSHVSWSALANELYGSDDGISVYHPKCVVSNGSSVVYTTPGDFYPALSANTKWAVGNHEISWGASTNAQSYSVYVKTPTSSSYTCVASGLTSRSYTYNFSQTGTYVYYIRAVNGDKIKDTQTVTITCGYGPGSYTLNNPGNFTVGTKTISWTASSNATRYTVFLKAPGGSYTSVYSGTALSFSYNFTTVGTYSIYMRAYNNYSESGVVSSTYTFTVSARPTDTPTPTPNNKPGSFSVSSLGIREIGPHTITWTSSERATSYELWVKVPCLSSSASEYELVYSGPDTSYTYDFSVYVYGKYYYYVKAVNSYGSYTTSVGEVLPYKTMWYTGSYTGSQVDAEGNRSTKDASSIQFHLVGLSNVEMYYTVVKDGVLVYTSPIGYYDYQGPVYGTYDAENGNAPLVNGCLQKGLYTITYYYANGDFLTSSSITVINTAMNTPTPTATNTPTPTATSTPTPTNAPITPTPAVPTQVPCNPHVADFVERLYTVALGRTSEQEGKNYWITALQNGASGAEAAHGFFFAPEVTDANLSNVEFVTRLYRTFMDRSPDDAGLEYWINAIYSGMTREEVFYGFINSTEWINICENCGINPGANTNPDDGRRELVVAFATRLYSTCLGREGDQGGIDYWTDLLISGNATGTFAAHEFFFGPEFVDGNYSNVEFIRRLYLTFMGREADDGGLEYWLTSFSNGMTREQVFAGFANSDEFREICNQAGIQP